MADYSWLDSRMAEAFRYNPEATVADGLLYAALCLHRDIDDGALEGEFNLYDAVTASSKNEVAERMGVNRVTLWRRLKDLELE